MRVAVLGLGFMGSTHIEALRQIAGAELAAVYSSDEKKLAGDLRSVGGNLGARNGQVDFSGVQKYREVEAALADSAIEAVDICLPTYLHDVVAVEALRAGKHVLVEKPIAIDAYGADRMMAAARRSKRVLMTAHVLRFSPEYEALRKAVRQATYGGLRLAQFRRRCAAPQWSDWLKDTAKCGGGAFDLLIHDVDMVLHLFGKPKAVSACGAVDQKRGLDTMEAHLFYEGGAVAVVSGGWLYPGEYPFCAEYAVTLEGGTIEYRSGGRPPMRYGADGSIEVLETAGWDGYRAEIEYFLECCRTGQTPEFCPPAESADAVKMMTLLMEARSRNGVKLACRI
ncbi:MAG TPA: Gfo/Idh/MocA family oxidoreductase [Bryobacteraceae bacterium]|nr:Gfo/Idh/MocA family oxidoreductase [Bryobacteraceae bacterium]